MALDDAPQAHREESPQRGHSGRGKSEKLQADLEQAQNALPVAKEELASVRIETDKLNDAIGQG